MKVKKEKYKIIEYPHWDKANNEITLCLQSEAEKTENGKIKIPLKNNPIENYGKFKIIGEVWQNSKQPRLNIAIDILFCAKKI